MSAVHSLVSFWGAVGDAHLHDLVLELGEELVDNLVLLDGERVEVDLLHALDLAGLYETAELGDGLPLLLVLVAAPASTTTSTTATAAVAATVAATGSEAAAAGSTGSSISHICDCAVPRQVLMLSLSGGC